MTDYENDFNDGEYDDTHEQDVDKDDYQMYDEHEGQDQGEVPSNKMLIMMIIKCMMNMKVRIKEKSRLTSVRC